MKKRGGAAVEILILLGGWLLLPTTIWAGSIYGPSGVAAGVSIYDKVDPDPRDWIVLAGCDSGLIPLAASCDPGPRLGFSSAGDAFSASASSSAVIATGGLTVTVNGAGSDDIQEDAGASAVDTLFFHGGNAQQTGTMTMTANGTWAGNGVATELLHVTYFKDFGFFNGNGPWVINAQAWTDRPGTDDCHSSRGAEACEASDGQLLIVSVTFPLSDEGVQFAFSLSARSFGDGGVNYTDPITLTLPPGVTFTSDSGVFLTQPEGPAAVPEPSSTWLLGIGMAGMVGLRQTRSFARRKRKP